MNEIFVETLFDGKMKAWTNIVRNTESNANQYKRPFKNKVEAVNLGCQAAQILKCEHQIRSKDVETWEKCIKH
jgi:hypothetical protein